MTATTRLVYPGTAAAGDVLTAANVNRLPGGWLAFDSDTSTFTISTTATDVISFAVSTAANRRLRVTATCHISLPDDGDAMSVLASVVVDGTTIAGANAAAIANAHPGITVPVVVVGYVSVAASGSHTVTLAVKLTGTGAYPQLKGSPYATTLSVEDVGPSPS